MGALKPGEQFTGDIRDRTTQLKMIKPALRVGSDRSTLRREEMVCLDRKLHQQPGMVDGDATATA